MVDTFAGPPKKQGVIGRLILDRALANYGFDITIAITGLSSETITLASEGVSGSIVGYPTIYRGDTKLGSSILQNGTYSIRIDDVEPTWDNIAFIKSGSLDRVKINIESAYDYVEPTKGRIIEENTASTAISVDGWGYGGWGTMPFGG